MAATLADDGYEIHPGAVFLEDDELRSAIRDTRFQVIFGWDALRQQGTLPETLQGIRRRLRRFAAGRGLPAPGRGVVLRSLPGCRRQPFHTDYDTSSEAAVDARTLVSYLVAIEPGTRFALSPSRELALGVGDVLVFRGDLVHAGSAYAQLHHRIHFYQDGVGPANATYPVEPYASLPEFDA